MKRLFGAWAATLLLSGIAVAEDRALIRVELDLAEPERSRGTLRTAGGKAIEFRVGYGRNGVLKEGSRFRDGYSLLGRFRVNAVLSSERFEMAPELIASSGKDLEWLRQHLFRNMSSLDFDGDGRGGEYGAAFIGLEPLNDVPQPFGFHPYKGVFRWYSFALHGTQDEARVGRRVTGGCINLAAADLARVAAVVKLGDVVEIVAANEG